MGKVYETDINGNAQGQGNDGNQGPSYRDVRHLAHQIEKQYSTRISFRVDPADVFAGWKAAKLHVRATAHLAGDGEAGAVYAGAEFGGNGGSKTLPGAMIAALYYLDERLSTRWIDDPPDEDVPFRHWT